MLDPEMFSYHEMFIMVLLRVDGDGCKCMYPTYHITREFIYYSFLVYQGRLFFRDSPTISDRLACEHWLQLLINFRSKVVKLSENHVSRFLIFKGQMNQNLNIFSSAVLKRRNVKQNIQKETYAEIFLYEP